MHTDAARGLSIPTSPTTRRGFLGVVALGGAAMALPVGRAVAQPGSAASPADHFPSQDPKLVQEIVGASHGNFPRVKELIEASPALAKASVDWGFGDWESALGAASHVGNRTIAEYLIAKGARPDIFTCAMMGWLDAVRGAVEAQPGVQKIRGPHGFTLMHHARVGGERALPVVEYLQRIGGADEAYNEAPLDDAARLVYVGTYAYGPAPDEVLEVTDERGSVWVARPGRSGRRLVALGEHAFFPVGAEGVRLRFGVAGGKARTLVVHDPDPIVTATRKG